VLAPPGGPGLEVELWSQICIGTEPIACSVCMNASKSHNGTACVGNRAMPCGLRQYCRALGGGNGTATYIDKLVCVRRIGAFRRFAFSVATEHAQFLSLQDVTRLCYC
jgi:hypothetical protein